MHSKRNIAVHEKLHEIVYILILYYKYHRLLLQIDCFPIIITDTLLQMWPKLGRVLPMGPDESQRHPLSAPISSYIRGMHLISPRKMKPLKGMAIRF